MHFKAVFGLSSASHFISLAWSFGTIVEVYPSICSALLSGPIPSMQYLLTVISTPLTSGLPTYITADGNTTADCGAAAPFILNNGLLSSNGQFVSATGFVPYSPLAASPYIGAISTTFSVMKSSILTWNNTRFPGGHATFCIMDSTVEVVYNGLGLLPSGCAQVFLRYVPADSCSTFRPSSPTTVPTVTGSGTITSTGSSSPVPTQLPVPGSVKGSNTTADAIGCLSSSGDAPAVYGGLASKPVTTLEECVEYCSIYAYFGVQNGLCFCGNTLSSSATPAIFGSCNVACAGNNAQNCGGDNTMAVYSISGRSGSGSTASGMSTTRPTGPTGQVSSSMSGVSTITETGSAGQVSSTATTGMSTITETGSAGQTTSPMSGMPTTTRTGSGGQASSPTSGMSTMTMMGSGGQVSSPATASLSTITETASAGQTSSPMSGMPTTTETGSAGQVSSSSTSGMSTITAMGSVEQTSSPMSGMPTTTETGSAGQVSSSSTSGMSTITEMGSAGQTSSPMSGMPTTSGTGSAGQVSSTATSGMSTITGTGSAGQASPPTSGPSTMTMTGSGGQVSSSVTGGMSTTTGAGSAGGIGSSMTATSSSMTGYVTSTGLPNCYDRSPFDQTVNGDYLILCNTALPGFDITSANGTSLAECIAACTAYSSDNANNACIAVTFDITASSNQCRLKSDIGVVNVGADDLSEAAVIVTGAYAPQIVFATAVSTMSSTRALNGSTSSAATVLSSMTSAATVSTSESVSTSSTISTPTLQGPLPTVTNPSGALCPTYNGQVVNVGGSYYQVECSTDTIGDTLIANTTTAASLAECGRYCNLYSLAIPYGCIGVTLLRTSSNLNCYLKSKITGTEFRTQDDSLRLIYPGYPAPIDPILTAIPVTGPASSSFKATISTATPTQSSSSTEPTVTGSLCPAYNGQVLYFSSYGGSRYEIECSTNFADNDLPAVLATNLTDCVNQCSFLNVNTEIPQCVGVTFLNTPQPNPQRNNCYPKNSITTIVRGIPQDDSARLILSSYPSATDMGTAAIFSTPTRPLSATIQSSLGRQPVGTTQSTQASSMVTDITSTNRATVISASITSMTLTMISSATSVPSPTGSLCPRYSFQVIQAGNYQYEIECGFEIEGHEIGLPYSPYPAIQSFQQCLAACNYWNENTATLCVAVDFQAEIDVCYLKDDIRGRHPSLRINAARLIQPGYPIISDAVSTASSSTFTPTSPTLSPMTSASSAPKTSSFAHIAAASLYPAEPICPAYNGGQLTSLGSTLYNIECNVDLRYAPSDLAATSVLYAATYSDCALICDQYNVNAGSRICQGFTWDSASTIATATNCVLKSSRIQTSTANTANRNGVHSGRLLGPWPATNQVILSRPVPLVTNTLYNGYSITYDFAALTAPGGLAWQITESSSPTLYVGAMGFLALSRTDLNNPAGLTALSNSNNNDSQPYNLPSAVLPDYAVAAYWNRGYASLNSQQGIYYQIETISSGRYFISIEFIYARFTTNNDIFHWITTYDTASPGVWTSWHFSGGSADGRGLYQTVGHQGTQTLNGVAGSPIAALYERGQAGTVNSGDRIVFDTNPETNTVVHVGGAFNVARYGVPGTWSYTNSPT